MQTLFGTVGVPRCTGTKVQSLTWKAPQYRLVLGLPVGRRNPCIEGWVRLLQRDLVGSPSDRCRTGGLRAAIRLPVSAVLKFVHYDSGVFRELPQKLPEGW